MFMGQYLNCYNMAQKIIIILAHDEYAQTYKIHYHYLKFDNVKSVAANIFDSTSQIASDINNERTSSVLSNEYSKASPVKKKKKRKERQSKESHGEIDDKEPFERSPKKKIKRRKQRQVEDDHSGNYGNRYRNSASIDVDFFVKRISSIIIIIIIISLSLSLSLLLA